MDLYKQLEKEELKRLSLINKRDEISERIIESENNIKLIKEKIEEAEINNTVKIIKSKGYTISEVMNCIEIGILDEVLGNVDKKELENEMEEDGSKVSELVES